MGNAIEPGVAPRGSEGLDRETLLVAGVVTLGTTMSILDTTVVNVAINHLALAFHAPLTTIQWIVTGYTLALAAVIPATGWAVDRFGAKRIYMTSLVLFTLGSVASGLAWSATSLILFRVLQGLGGGMILPSVMTIVTRRAGPGRMGRVMGLMSVPMLIAPMFGPMLGGWLIDDVSWRWIFFINVPIGVVAFILAHRVLESDPGHRSQQLDWLGMLLLSPGLAIFIYGLAESASHGVDSTRALGPAALGLLLIACFLVHSWRSPTALIDLRTFTRTGAGVAALAFLLFGIVIFGVMLLQPLYFQSVRGTSAFTAGLLLAPGGLGTMLTTPLAGRLTDRHTSVLAPAIGIPLVGLSLVPFALVGPHTSYALLCCAVFIQGMGVGMVLTPTMTAAMRAVPKAAIARTSTAWSIVRQGSGSIGTALVSVILAAAITSNLASVAGLGHVGSSGLAAVQGLSARQHALVAEPLANSFATTFRWVLAFLAVALIPAVAMLRVGHAHESVSVWEPVAEASRVEVPVGVE